MVSRVGRTLRDCTPGSRMGTVIVNFGTRLHANPQTAQKMQELAAHVCTGCCSQLISRMFSEVAHMYLACLSTRRSWPCWGYARV